MSLGRRITQILLTGVLLCGMPAGSAAQQTIADVFREMPDSLLPTLSKNNRLDMIDFMSSGMKAEVTNRLGGRSEMTALTDDSLCVRISQALTVTCLLLTPEEPVDSCHQIVCMVRTYGIDETTLHTVVDYFTPQWVTIQEKPLLNDAAYDRIGALDLQTILNWEDKTLKKD